MSRTVNTNRFINSYNTRQFPRFQKFQDISRVYSSGSCANTCSDLDKVFQLSGIDSTHGCDSTVTNWTSYATPHEITQPSQGLNIGQGESQFINQLCSCRGNNQWCFIHNKVLVEVNNDCDTPNDFGFIIKSPLITPLFRPSTQMDCIDIKRWACDAHIIVKQTGQPNYASARIQVPTELNIANWRKLCGNYRDQLLLDYLEFGFPLCVHRDQFQFNSLVENHPSAVNFPSDVDTYFHKELAHKAIVGPYDNFPFPVHYSPMLSRPKPDDTRRVIVNLSYPYGASLNDCICDTTYDNVHFKLRYPAVQDIVNEIEALHSDVLLSKIDISRAFRNLRIDPKDFDLLGLKWRDASYLDISVPMGLKTGSALCQRVTDVLRHVMRSKNVTLFNYIDDVICVHRRQNADAEFKMLYSLFEFLGIPVNPKKVVPPTRSLTCMGVILDVDAGQMSIPQSKCLEILDLCYHYRACSHITKKQLQSLLGKLLYLHRCVIPARTFVNRLLNKLRQTTTRVKVCDDVKKDLTWFIQFLLQFNGKIMFTQAKPEYDVFVDACLTGLGATWNDHAYAVSRHLPATWHLNITQLEMLNVLIVLRVFGDAWRHKSVCIHIDNKAAMFSLNKACIKDKFMQAVSRSVWLTAAIYDITVKFVHIAGQENQKADLLSRVFQSVANVKELEKQFPNFNWWHVSAAMFYPNTLI